MTMMAIGMPAGMAVTGALLQWLPAWVALLTLAGLQAVVVAYCGSKRELWRASGRPEPAVRRRGRAPGAPARRRCCAA